MKHHNGFWRVGITLGAALLATTLPPIRVAADASAEAFRTGFAGPVDASAEPPLLLLAAAGDESPGGADERVEQAADAPGAFLPLECTADQTGGFHDYPDDDESYTPALFNATPFRLDENVVFMTNLPEQPGVDLYVTLTAGEDPVTTELECRQVRGVDGNPGYSCVNIPPSEMLLINRQTLRFTRTAVGGWTFAGANATHSGDSIFVEYGTCAAAAAP